MAETTRRRRTVIVDYDAASDDPVDLSVEETLDLLAHHHATARITDHLALEPLPEALPVFRLAGSGSPFLSCTHRLDPEDHDDCCDEITDHWVLWPDGGVSRSHGEAACEAHRDPEEWVLIFTGDADGLARIRRVEVTKHSDYAGGTCTFPGNPDDPEDLCRGDADLTVFLDSALTSGRDGYEFDMACADHSSRRAWAEVLL